MTDADDVPSTFVVAWHYYAPTLRIDIDGTSASVCVPRALAIDTLSVAYDDIHGKGSEQFDALHDATDDALAMILRRDWTMFYTCIDDADERDACDALSNQFTGALAPFVSLTIA